MLVGSWAGIGPTKARLALLSGLLGQLRRRWQVQGQQMWAGDCRTSPKARAGRQPEIRLPGAADRPAGTHRRVGRILSDRHLPNPGRLQFSRSADHSTCPTTPIAESDWRNSTKISLSSYLGAPSTAVWDRKLRVPADEVLHQIAQPILIWIRMFAPDLGLERRIEEVDYRKSCQSSHPS